jgi:Sigma-70 factor, region 1.1
MQHSIAAILKLGKRQGYLTYGELNERLTDEEIRPEILNELLELLEEHKIGLLDDPEPGQSVMTTAARPGPDSIFHRFDPNEQERWKTYPIRMTGPRKSNCHVITT